MRHPRLANRTTCTRLLAVAALLLFPTMCRAQLSQTVVFSPTPTTPAYAGTSVILGAFATSGMPVTFSVASGPAQVSGIYGNTLTFIGVGTVVVQADQAGGNGYSPAAPAQASINSLLLTEPVTTSSQRVTTVITFTTAGTLAQITALTQGAPNLDFASRILPPLQGPACQPGISYQVGFSCKVDFIFTPTRPGIRYGGLTLSDAQGNLLANSYIYGYGVGPQVLYQPVLQSLVGNSLGAPTGVAINGNGDLFVSNESGPGLSEIAVNGTVTAIGSFTNGKDVAVDGSGNVLFQTADTLYEIQAVNGSIPASPTIRTLATGFTVDGGGIAVDGAGNAYVAQTPANSTRAVPLGLVSVVYAVGGIIPSNSTQQQIGPIFAGPTGVAVDSSGNVYLSDGIAPGIFEMLAVNGRVPASPTILSLGSGYSQPSNIRLDNTNDIFISDAGLPGILEYVATNGVVSPSAPPKSIGSAFIYPQGLLVDGSGNVFVADGGYSQVVKLNYSSVPTLNFATTNVGQTSSDSPQAVTYTNAGNAPLIFTPPTSGQDPAITPSFTLGASSTCPQLSPGSPAGTLAVNASCTDQVSFTPLTGGPITGTLTTVDNDLSVPNATQIVHLNGTGILTTPTLTFNVPGHFVDDPPFTVAATSNSPGAITYSITSGPATVAGNTVTLTGIPGSVTITAAQAASSPYSATSATAIFSVIKHPQTINFIQPPTPVLITASPTPLNATATSGLPVTFSILSGPGTVAGNLLTLTGYGTITIAADQPGNNIYAAAPEVTRQVVVLDNRLTITLTGTPNPVFLKDPITFTSTVTSPAGTPTGSILFLDGTTPLATIALTGNAATFTTSSLALGTHTITAVYSGDPTFASATSAPLSVLVEDFALTIANPQITIPHGGTAVYNLTVITVGGTNMASTIQFAIAGNPDHSPATFSPAQVATGSGTTSITLTIQTPDYPVGPFTQLRTRTLTLAFLALLPAVALNRKRRRTLSSRLALLFLTLALATTAITGCGWGAQPYSMTVTASSGALSHTVSAHLVSQ